jgi:hypothetical protein
MDADSYRNLEDIELRNPGALLSPMEVPMAKQIDLRGDNEIPVLLSRRAELYGRRAADKDEIDWINDQLTQKLGDADSARVAGGTLTRKRVKQRAHWRAEVTYLQLKFKPL